MLDTALSQKAPKKKTYILLVSDPNPLKNTFWCFSRDAQCLPESLSTGQQRRASLALYSNGGVSQLLRSSLL